jgi:hypothetical protein
MVALLLFFPFIAIMVYYIREGDGYKEREVTDGRQRAYKACE